MLACFNEKVNKLLEWLNANVLSLSRWWWRRHFKAVTDSQAVWSIQRQHPFLPSLPRVRGWGLAQQQAALPLLHIRLVIKDLRLRIINSCCFFSFLTFASLFFFSATFQKIKPMLPPLAGRVPERGSNYCVTLVVGDKSPDSEPPLMAAAGWQQDPRQQDTCQQDPLQDSSLRSFSSLPRPRNKSVFKKLFCKKDLWVFTYKRFYKLFLMCSAHLCWKAKKTPLLLTIFMMGRASMVLCLMCFVLNHLSLFYECFYIVFSRKRNNTVWVCTA